MRTFGLTLRVTLISDQSIGRARKNEKLLCPAPPMNLPGEFSAARGGSDILCCGNLGEFFDSSLEFLHYLPGRASLFVNFDEFVEIPQLLLASSLEPTPDLRTDLSVLLQNCTRVVQFIRNGHQ